MVVDRSDWPKFQESVKKRARKIADETTITYPQAEMLLLVWPEFTDSTLQWVVANAERYGGKWEAYTHFADVAKHLRSDKPSDKLVDTGVAEG